MTDGRSGGGPRRLPAVIPRGQAEHDVYRRAREQHWYAQAHFGPCFVRHRDLERLSKDPRFVSPGVEILHVQGITKGAFHDWWARMMFSAEGEDHRRLRTLVSRAFVPRGVEQLRSGVRDTVDRLCLGAAADGRGTDLAERLAAPLSRQVLWPLLGVPAEDADAVSQWSTELNLCFMVFYTAVARARLNRAVREFYDYLGGLFAAKRRAPADDLISHLIAARDGEDRLSEEELMATATTLVIGGQETVAYLVANAVWTLLRHPAQWEAVRDDPALARGAIEEVLRFEPPGGGLYRLAAEDLVWDDLAISRGSIVFGSSVAANRDPDVFADPDRFDIGRDPNPHLSFGGGPHFCLGASIARVLGQEALAGVARHFPDIRLATDDPPWNDPDRVFRGLTSLPVTLR